MPRLLFFCLIAAMIACGTNSNPTTEQVTTKFQQKRHDAQLDQQVQPLLNQYFAVMQHLSEQDTANLQVYGASLIQLADSLSHQQLSLDTATQSNALQGLMNIQSEMEAILMESSTGERLFGAQMLSLHWIDFLAAIGYQKQTIYLCVDNAGNQWMSLTKKAVSPYLQEDKKTYEAMQVLQELK